MSAHSSVAGEQHEHCAGSRQQLAALQRRWLLAFVHISLAAYQRYNDPGIIPPQIAKSDQSNVKPKADTYDSNRPCR